MKFKTLFTILSVVAVINGLGCFLAPEMMLASFGVELPPMGLVVYRFWGSTLMGLGMILWFSRGIEDLKIQKNLSVSMLVFSILSIFPAKEGQFSGANTIGWSMVVLFGLLSLGFGSLLILKIRKTGK